MQLDRYKWVDSLKGIAICAIVLSHAGLEENNSIIAFVEYAGAKGIQLFLLLVGFYLFHH